jgi:pyrroloquinoline quinone (PQQ) biosynthesis protein C
MTPKKKIDDDMLKRLWPSRLSDKEIAERMGHHRGVLRRRAAAIGLPTRRAIWSAATSEAASERA